MVKEKTLLFVILLLSISLFNCNGRPMPEKKIFFGNIKDVPKSKWKKLSEKKIYFAHDAAVKTSLYGLETKPLVKNFEDPKPTGWIAVSVSARNFPVEVTDDKGTVLVTNLGAEYLTNYPMDIDNLIVTDYKILKRLKGWFVRVAGPHAAGVLFKDDRHSVTS